MITPITPQALNKYSDSSLLFYIKTLMLYIFKDLVVENCYF